MLNNTDILCKEILLFRDYANYNEVMTYESTGMREEENKVFEMMVQASKKDYTLPFSNTLYIQTYTIENNY